jgi:hypothetical protein
MRGKLAIGITVNFVNGRTVEETQVPEISGVARIYNQKFFQSLLKATGQGPLSLVFLSPCLTVDWLLPIPPRPILSSIIPSLVRLCDLDSKRERTVPQELSRHSPTWHEKFWESLPKCLGVCFVLLYVRI